MHTPSSAQARPKNHALHVTSYYIPFTGRKFTNSPGSPSKPSFGTGSTRLRLLRARQPNESRPQSRSLQRVAQDAAQMQPRERMQPHQPTHGTLLAHISPPRPFFGFFFFFFFLSDQSIDESFFKAKPL